MCLISLSQFNPQAEPEREHEPWVNLLHWARKCRDLCCRRKHHPPADAATGACRAGDTVLLGAFTDGDLRRSLQRRGAEALTLPLSEVMTSAPRTCRSDLKAVDAMQVLNPRLCGTWHFVAWSHSAIASATLVLTTRPFSATPWSMQH